MQQAQKKTNINAIWQKWAFNLSSLLIIVSGVFLLRAPLLINADYFFNFDEAYQGSQILDLLKGAPIFFYYEGERYAGIFLGLAAAPFFWLFGVSAFAYKAPGTLAYALYIMSSYWVVKKIHPSAALTTVLLMVFPPYIVLYVSSNNWQHNLILFLGNIIFLFFFNIKTSDQPKKSTLFFLGAVIGFSIYSYTYSILYIASIAVLFVLSHEHWNSVRSKISVKVLFAWFQQQESGKLKFVRVLDVIIVFFVLATLFSYVFGGFGIDIAGQSVLQINKLHKPVSQILILLTLRVLIFRKDIDWKLWCLKTETVLSSIAPKGSISFGVMGFIIGISPRIMSIATGETTKGGQGFDVDFNPVKIVTHMWELVTYYIPEFFDIRGPIISFFNTDWTTMSITRGLLAIAMAFLIIRSVTFIFAPRWDDLKKIAQLKSIKFDLVLVLMVLLIFLCFAVVIIPLGADLRYLIPLHGLVSIWVAIYLDKIRQRSKILFASSLLIWCGFCLLNTYSFYTKPVPGYPYPMAKVIRDFSVYKYPNPYLGLLEYCRINKVSYVYSGMITAHMLNFYGNGDIIAAVYDQDKTVRRKKLILSSRNDFAVIVSKNSVHQSIYKKHLENSSLKYSQELINNEFWILNDFVGDPADIDSLRSLVPAIF